MEGTRKYWVETMLKIAHPVLDSMSRNCLRKEMPIEDKAERSRSDCTHLEALGRTLVGLAPWLEAPDTDTEESELREKYANMARAAIANGVDPSSEDHLNFSEGYQPIVDAAFLAHAILRSPNQLWAKLDDTTKQRLVSEMKNTRTRKPYFNNWLLFSAMIESFLYLAGESDWDQMRIDFALKQHMQWYKGDSIYSDGKDVHVDYYNSFVIHPMIVDILETVGDQNADWNDLRANANKYMTRYASILEMLICPDGTYPIVGRSVAYRFGAFQALSQAALQDKLAKEITPAQVRCALTAVIQKIMSYKDNFDQNGWLRIGVCGHQPMMGETYISTGSLYLCTAVFLPLGLSPNHPFWSGADCKWTSQKIWGGDPGVKVDHALTS